VAHERERRRAGGGSPGADPLSGPPTRGAGRTARAAPRSASRVRYCAAVGPTEFTVRPLTLDRSTLNEVGVVSARAFYDDPFFIHLSQNPMQRARGLALFWRSHVAALGDTAVVTGAHGGTGALVGVSVWQRPGTYPLPVWTQARESAGAFRAMIPAPSSLLIGFRYILAMEKARPREDHWYLALLVTDPMVWRRGIGTALLEPTLASIDEEGLPCYLETQKEANLAYYRRFGFEEARRLTPSRSGPPLFTLSRPSR
jgi:ribosomal protein S18 acetylase RimI-like enzyme